MSGHGWRTDADPPSRSYCVHAYSCAIRAGMGKAELQYSTELQINSSRRSTGHFDSANIQRVNLTVTYHETQKNMRYVPAMALLDPKNSKRYVYCATVPAQWHSQSVPEPCVSLPFSPVQPALYSLWYRYLWRVTLKMHVPLLNLLCLSSLGIQRAAERSVDPASHLPSTQL